MISRRLFNLGIFSVTALAAPSITRAKDFCAIPGDDFGIRTNPQFSEWVNAFAARAMRRGISRDTIVAGFRGGGYIPGVVQRDGSQFQTRRTLEDYIAIATSPARLEMGRAAIGRHQNLLRNLQGRYGVDAFIIAAIWGVESRYGTRLGDVPVVSATATLAFQGRRRDLFESQLLAALKILQSGDIAAQKLTGSWAGAMGHTQFIPTSYLSFAVDYNGDGRRDVWSRDPTDALASTAAYLARNGWVVGQSWGGEVGQTRAKGTIIRPQANGPRFVTTKNHRVIRRYNNSAAYAVTVGHLADRLRGAGPLQGRFPDDANGLSKSNRIDIQNALVRKRYDIGDVDGVIGPKTRCAIQNYQQRNRLPVDGQATSRLFRRLAN